MTFNLDKARSRILIINCLIIVFLLNMLARMVNFRFDLTQNKIHSLSAATKRILKDLDDIVTIKIFMSEEIPEQLASIKTDLVWFIENYEKIGGGKVKTKSADPNKNAEAEKEVNNLGIPPIEFSTLKKDKFEVSRGYLSVVVSYGDKNEIVDLQNLSNLEYNLTSAVKKVTQEKLKTVAISAGEETETSEISFVNQLLEKSYEQKSFSLGEETEFDPTIDVLVINAPKETVSQNAEKVIDQYLQNQRGVLFLLDQYSVDNSLTPGKVNHGLNNLLAYYGITFRDGLILDPSSALAAFRTSQGGIIVPYPYWVKITPDGLNSKLPPTASLQTLTLPWASALETDKGAEWLVKSSAKAWQETTITSLFPDQKLVPPKGEEKEFVLAAVQTNPISSFFEKDSENKKEVRMAVVGDADFIKDNFVMEHEGNFQFFLNLIDFLAQEKDLIGIRSKPVINRPIRPLSDQEKQAVRVGNLALPLVLIVATYFLIKNRRDAHFKN